MASFSLFSFVSSYFREDCDPHRFAKAYILLTAAVLITVLPADSTDELILDAGSRADWNFLCCGVVGLLDEHSVRKAIGHIIVCRMSGYDAVIITALHLQLLAGRPLVRIFIMQNPRIIPFP